MARLVSVQGENFAGFESFDWTLAKQGLVFVIGDNRDTEAATSNGACKSGLFKALGWGLYGESIDSESGDKVIRRGTKSAQVVVNIVDGADAYSVVRERWKQAPKLRLEKNGEQVSASKADLQRAINALIGVDWEGFKNTVLYGQGDRDRFVYPTTKDADRKSILHRILGTGVFELCHVEAKKRRLAVEKELAATTAEIASLTQRIRDHDLDALRAQKDGHADDVARRVAQLTEQARELAERAKSVASDIDAPAKRAELEALDAAVEAGEQAVTEARRAHARAHNATRATAQAKANTSAELRAHMKALQAVQGDRCPVCTGDLTKGHAAAHRAELVAKGDALTAELKAGEQAEQATLRAERAADRALTEAEAEQRRTGERRARVAAELEAVETSKARVRELVARSREKTEEARVLKDAPNPYLDTYVKAKAKVRALKRDRKQAKARAGALATDLEHLAFWSKGFGPTGIPSFALDSVMPLLTDRANHYLLTLAGGDISIHFSTQRELKGGELRDEIGITWSIEGIDGYPPSGGQWKKMEIATNFALMDLVRTREGSHVNILCLDECLDGLDGEGRQRVVELLQGLRRERESIFLISHDPDLAEAFERTLIVIKEQGVSRLERAM